MITIFITKCTLITTVIYRFALLSEIFNEHWDRITQVHRKDTAYNFFWSVCFGGDRIKLDYIGRGSRFRFKSDTQKLNYYDINIFTGALPQAL